MNPSWRRYVRFWGARVDRDIDEELAFHFEMRVHDDVERGMSEPDARAAAATRFGDIARTRNSCLTIGHRRHRRMTRAQTIDAFAHDVRYALRTLGRQKGWTIVALLTLGLGIGASTTVFSVVDSLLLHPLPYANADRVATIWRSSEKTGMSITPPPALVKAFQESARSLEGIEPYRLHDVTLTGDGDAATLHAASIQGSFPRFAGLPLVAGRSFRSEEMLAGGPRVAMIGEAAWRDRFGADPAVLGKKLILDDRPYVVVGVAPAKMRTPGLEPVRTDVWLPLLPDSSGFSNHATVRVREGVTFDAAAQELDSIAARSGLNLGPTGFVMKLRRPDHFITFKKSLYLLSGAVALLLIVACANVAHLLLARGATREREIAIRTALGAGRMRLMRQLLTESLLLAALGCAIGLVVAVGGVKLLTAVRPARMSELALASVNGTALWAGVGLSAITGIAFGFTAAIHAVRRTTSDSLRATSLSGTGARPTQRLRSILVVTEMALSALLLVGATLLVRSVSKLERTDPGFDTAGLYTVRAELPPSRYSPAARASFVEQVAAGARGVPGVASVAIAEATPPEVSYMIGQIDAEGSPPGANTPSALAMNSVAPNYFSVIGLRVLSGATFGAGALERGDVIINDGFAKKLWPGENAVGHRLRFASPKSPAPWRTVVAVVGDVPIHGLAGDRADPLIYFPFNPEQVGEQATIAVRVSHGQDPVTPLRKVVATADPRLPPASVKTAAEALSETIATQRFTMLLLAVFACLAVLLSAVGLYGVISYVVTQRTREIGIRIALGATPRQVAHAVVVRGVVLSAIGLAIGLVGAVWGTKVIASALYGVTGTDPFSYGVTAALLLVVSLLACLVPMSRAMRVDPVIAMRGD